MKKKIIFLFRLWIYFLFSNITTYPIVISIFIDDGHLGTYVNSEIFYEGLGEIVNYKTFYNISVEGGFGDNITLHIRNRGGTGGIDGYIKFLDNIFKTDDFPERWTTSLPGGFDESLFGTGYSKCRYLGLRGAAIFNVSFTIPIFYDVSNEEKIISHTDFIFDINKYFQIFYIQVGDITYFQISKLPEHGLLKMLDGNVIKLEEKYLIQKIKYVPNKEGGYKDNFFFAITNSTNILSNPGKISLTVCWEGCKECKENELCKNEDCSETGKKNCVSCLDGFGEYIIEDESRKECWDNSKIHPYFYLDKSLNRYFPCYSRCETCIEKGNDNVHNCISCLPDYYIVHSTTNCEKKAWGRERGYYLDKEDNQHHKCSNNCSKCSEGPKNGINFCTECEGGYELRYKNCYPRKDSESEVIEVDFPASGLLEQNVEEICNENVIIKGNNYASQVYRQSTKEKVNEVSDIYKLSTIEIDSCVNFLYENNLITGKDLIILKIDMNSTNSLINQVYFLLYEGNNKLVDYSGCINSGLILEKPVVNKKAINYEQAYENSKLSINDFDPTDDFFNDRCFPYSSSNNTDVTLSDRRKDYYKNVSLCEQNCELDEVAFEAGTVKCKCHPISNEETIININQEQSTLSEIKKSFLKSISPTNLLLIKCYESLYNGLFSNSGFFIIGLIFILELFIFILFIRKGFKYFWIKLEVVHRILQSQEEKEKENEISDTKIMASQSSQPVLYTLGGYHDNPLKGINEKVNLVSQKDSKFLRKNAILKNPESTIDNTRNNVTFYNKKQILESDFKVEITKISYEEMTYKVAFQKDRRKFSEILLNTLSIKHYFFSLFCSNCIYNNKNVEVFLFVFMFCLELSLNSIFFSDSEISKMYHNNDLMRFVSSLPRIVYSNICTCIIHWALVSLSQSSSKIRITLIKCKNLDWGSARKNLEKVVKVLKVKLFFFYLICFTLIIFFWYYIICFCYVYSNSQISWIISGIISFIVGLMWSMISILLLALLRYCSLSMHLYHLFSIYKFLMIFM